MKTVFSLALILCFAIPSVCQTKIIAHKSHSGLMSAFSANDYDDNMGIVPVLILNVDTVIKIDEQRFVHIRTFQYEYDQNVRRRVDTSRYSDLFRNHTPTYELFKASFNENAVFIGFDSTQFDQQPPITEEKMLPTGDINHNLPSAFHLVLTIIALMAICSGFIWLRFRQKLIL